MKRLLDFCKFILGMMLLASCGGGSGGSDSGTDVSKFQVSTSITGSGAVSPQSQLVFPGTSASFSITPGDGYKVDSIVGCGGTLTGSTYTTGFVESDCTIDVIFVEQVIDAAKLQVNTTVTGSGVINPQSLLVAPGTSAAFSVTPGAGFTVDSINGCEGILEGSIYTTGSITTDCTIAVTFKEQVVDVSRFRVNTTVAGGGVINPQNQLVISGSNASFSVNSANGFAIDRVAGCDGVLNETTYTTGPITADCTITATFKEQIIDVPKQQKTIVVVVDPTILPQISVNLSKFIEAVELDTGAVVEQIPSPPTPLELKEKLIGTNNLWGAYFIGSIPVVYEHIKSDVTETRNLSDNYYRTKRCPYGAISPELDGSFTIEAGSEFSVLSTCESEIWLSRIKGTTSSNEVAEINHYLQTNIAERHNVTGYSAGMTFIAATRDAFSAGGYADLFKDHPLFNMDQVFSPELPTAIERRTAAINCLQSGSVICKINAHGAPDWLSITGVEFADDLSLTSSDIDSLTVTAKIVELESCSAGSFASTNYIAGKILFSSKTLLVRANPMPTFYTNDALTREAKSGYFALGGGRSLADVYTRTQQGQPPHFFGDPTISAKSLTETDSSPRLVIENQRFHEPFSYPITAESVGGATVERSIRVTNFGRDDLVINGRTIGNFHTVDDLVPSCMASGCPLAFQLNPPLAGFEMQKVIPAGETEVFKFVFSPNLNDDSVLEGVHATKFRFTTNDPEIGAFDIPIEISASK